MSLFRSPEEHAQNPPSSWEVVKVADRVWHLRTASGGTLESFESKGRALEAREGGFLAREYEQEGRWYAGEDVAGWKPYAVVLEEQEAHARWLASKREQVSA